MTSKENADYLLEYAKSQGITENKELANFMGQMHVESANFSKFEESLHYSGDRLYEVFPGRNDMDSIAKANEIAKGGSKSIANAIYGGSWGEKNLGNTEPGDGWKFRGRGYVQLTGRAQYEAMGKELGLDLANRPELVANRDVAAKVAVQYWKDNVVRYGYQENVDKATHSINKKDEGLKERRAAAAAWEHKLEQGYVPCAPEPAISHALKQGARGDDVKQAQEELHDLGYLHADPNGRFGPATKAAAKDFQHDQGLDKDGKIGPVTQHHLDAAVRDKQITDLTAGSRPLLRDFSDPNHPQNAMYCTLKDLLPKGTSDERLAQATAACYLQGIDSPGMLASISGANGQLVFGSNSSLAPPATVDMTQPAPSVQQSTQHIQQYDQQQAKINTQIQEQNAQLNQHGPQGPTPGGPQGPIL